MIKLFYISKYTLADSGISSSKILLGPKEGLIPSKVENLLMGIPFAYMVLHFSDILKGFKI